MSITEIPENILNTLKSRFSNPLLSSAIISWPFINYKLMLVLLGEGGYGDKIKYIETKLYTFPLEDYVKVFFLPLIIGVVYWLWYTPIDAKITAYSIRKARDKAAIILAEERKIPFDQDEQVAYFQRHDAEKIFWKSALQESHKSAALTQDAMRAITVDLASKLRLNTRKLFALKCGIGSGDVYALEIAFSQNDLPFPPVEIVAKIRNYEYYNQLRIVASEAVNIPRFDSSAKREINLTWLRNNARVEDGHEEDFLEFLWALQIIDIDSYRPKNYVALDDFRYGKINSILKMVDEHV